jgi:hypothetical protein
MAGHSYFNHKTTPKTHLTVKAITIISRSFIRFEDAQGMINGQSLPMGRRRIQFHKALEIEGIPHGKFEYRAPGLSYVINKHFPGTWRHHKKDTKLQD